MVRFVVVVFLSLAGCELPPMQACEPAAPVVLEAPAPRECLCPELVPPELAECVQREPFAWECSGTNLCAAYPELLTVSIVVECAP